MTRIALQSAARAGTVALLAAYCADVEFKAQIYRARVNQAKAPCFYVESITEVLTPFTIEERQRTARVTVRALWGKFDDGEAVDQRDAFVDGFLDWVADNPHAFGANTDVNAVAVADDPEFDFKGTSYFSSAIALEGFAST